MVAIIGINESIEEPKLILGCGIWRSVGMFRLEEKKCIVAHYKLLHASSE